MKINRKIIKIDEELCNGCGQCVPSCAEGALVIEDGKARMIADKYCDGLGACLGECPMGALSIEEREADDFDEIAVEEHLAKQKKPQQPAPIAGGCPSANIARFQPAPMAPAKAGEIPSALSHWPVQIMLVPPTAPFLKDADLLVVADCVPVAFANFHQEFLQGKVVMMGCPKFDDVKSYVDKFEAICRESGIRSITTVVMEVPCCSGLPMIVKKGMAQAQSKLPIKEVVISTRGQILKRG